VQNSEVNEKKALGDPFGYNGNSKEPITPSPDEEELRKNIMVGEAEDPAEIARKLLSQESEKGTFVVEVKLAASPRKTRPRLGLTLDWDDGYSLVVTNTEPGLIEDWNSQHPDEKVSIGDSIVSVNDSILPPKELADVLDGLAKQDAVEREVRLLVRRHSEYDVALIRKDATEKLGIELRHREGGNTLLVRQILEQGIVADWNRKHAGDSIKIKVGDRVIEVNGTRGSGTVLNEKVKAKESLIMTLVRGQSSATD